MKKLLQQNQSFIPQYNIIKYHLTIFSIMMQAMILQMNTKEGKVTVHQIVKRHKPNKQHHSLLNNFWNKFNKAHTLLQAKNLI